LAEFNLDFNTRQASIILQQIPYHVQVITAATGMRRTKSKRCAVAYMHAHQLIWPYEGDMTRLPHWVNEGSMAGFPLLGSATGCTPDNVLQYNSALQWTKCSTIYQVHFKLMHLPL